MSPQTQAVQHPLIEHHLCGLRSVATTAPQFRQHLKQLSVLLAYAATADLPVGPCEVVTPLSKMSGKAVESRIGLVPILRAGLGMVEPVLELIPDSEVWHLGLYRDEVTSEPVEYYSRLEGAQPVQLALILDPMLATGGSALAAIGRLTEWGVSRIKLLSVIAAPEGIERIRGEFPEVEIYVCAVDEKLNSVNFIVPGLGDAGDRCFNTCD